jgi:hypothetical protein
MPEPLPLKLPLGGVASIGGGEAGFNASFYDKSGVLGRNAHD